MSGIAIFNAAVGKLQESQGNLMKMRAARQKMDFEKEDQEFQRKKNEIELEDAKRKGQMSDLQYDIVKEQQKAFNKQQDEISKGQIAQWKVAEHQQKTTADEAMNWAKIGYKSDPQGVTNFLTAYKKNQERKSMIVPEFSYGKVGYTTKDIEQPEAGYTRKDVVAQATKMAESAPRGSKVEDFMQEAEALLRGDQPKDMTQAETIPERPIRGQKQPVESSGQDSFRAGVDTVTRHTKPVEKQPTQGITKQFRNNKTGKLESFQKKDGKWVKI
jgi:hypothetical protein